MSVDEVRALLAGLKEDERQTILQTLRQDYRTALHPLEVAWNTTAEAILEAIHASPDLTQRGVRGILAEATFRTTVVPTQLQGWISIPFAGDLSYDLLLDDGSGEVKVQVKNQRREKGQAKTDAKLSRLCGFPVYVVETQRTRNGQNTDGEGAITSTRPYRFGEFDVLAVGLQPSTGSWTDFIYCAQHRLLARDAEPTWLKVMQPIYSDGSHGWTRDFKEAATAARMHLGNGTR